MFNYIIKDDYGENRILSHEKEFSQDEFNKMCNEIDSKNINEITRHLIYTYGFKNLNYTARWYIE